MENKVRVTSDSPCTIKVYGPEDNDELWLAEHGSDMYCALFELKEQFLRRKVHKGEHLYQTADEALEAVWYELHRILDDWRLTLNEVP